MWAALMTMLAELSGNYLCAQAAAGAQVLQVFDSWVGELSPVDYRRFVEPYTRQTINIARSAGVPIIHFGTGTAGLLPDIARTGADIIGIDWRIDMHHAARILGPQYILQGNLDPALLFAPWEIIEPAVRAIIDDMGYNPRHIFNLGHGILPGTPIDTVARLVDFVHSYSERYHG
jgi:uroporphyrinogen decarboxylase